MNSVICRYFHDEGGNGMFRALIFSIVLTLMCAGCVGTTLSYDYSSGKYYETTWWGSGFSTGDRTELWTKELEPHEVPEWFLETAPVPQAEKMSSGGKTVQFEAVE